MTPSVPSSGELARALAALSPLARRALLFSIGVNLLILAPTVYMLQVYDRVVNSRSQETLLMLTLFVLGCYALMEAFEWVRRETLAAAGEVLDRKLGGRLFAAVFQANLRKLRVGGPAVFGDFRALREFVSGPAVLAILDTPGSLLFLVIIFLINPILGYAATVVAAIQLLLTWVTERSTRATLGEASKEAVRAQSYATATLNNAEVVRAMGMRPQLHDRWMTIQRKHLQLQADASRQVAGTMASNKFFQLLQGSLMIGLGVWLTLIGAFPGGEALFVVASIIAGRAIAPLGQLIGSWKTISAARQSYARLDNLLTALPEPKPGMPLPPPAGKLAVEAVSAAPAGSNVILLRNISFALNPGTVLGVVGPTASGKSTLARLLVGLWTPQSGRVRLDGADVAQWNKSELGPHVGYLPQDVEIFAGTLAENIARFGDTDPARIEDALARAGLSDWVQTLENGLDTLVGEGGETLSGGQRQRVALARAIYGRPRLLVLDEPNASLDEEGERELVRTLLQLKAEGAAVVVITHRTSILAAVDQLLVLKDGAIVKIGPRDEVLAALGQAPAAPASSATPAARPGAPRAPGSVGVSPQQAG